MPNFRLDEDGNKADPTEPSRGIVERGLDRVGEEMLGEPKKPKNDLTDLFAVPHPEDNDMVTDHLFELGDYSVELEENMSDLVDIPGDLFSVSEPPLKPNVRPRPRYRRTGKPYIPPTSTGGLR